MGPAYRAGSVGRLCAVLGHRRAHHFDGRCESVLARPDRRDGWWTVGTHGVSRPETHLQDETSTSILTRSQSQYRKGFYCLQGIANLNECGPEDGGLMVLDGSHRLIEKFFEIHGHRPSGSWGPPDWFGESPIYERSMLIERVHRERPGMVLRTRLQVDKSVLWAGGPYPLGLAGDALQRASHRDS